MVGIHHQLTCFALGKRTGRGILVFPTTEDPAGFLSGCCGFIPDGLSHQRRLAKPSSSIVSLCAMACVAPIVAILSCRTVPVGNSWHVHPLSGLIPELGYISARDMSHLEFVPRCRSRFQDGNRVGLHVLVEVVTSPLKGFVQLTLGVLGGLPLEGFVQLLYIVGARGSVVRGVPWEGVMHRVEAF